MLSAPQGYLLSIGIVKMKVAGKLGGVWLGGVTRIAFLLLCCQKIYWYGRPSFSLLLSLLLSLFYFLWMGILLLSKNPSSHLSENARFMRIYDSLMQAAKLRHEMPFFLSKTLLNNQVLISRLGDEFLRRIRVC